jgi:hypothetical protein
LLYLKIKAVFSILLSSILIEDILQLLYFKKVWKWKITYFKIESKLNGSFFWNALSMILLDNFKNFLYASLVIRFNFLTILVMLFYISCIILHKFLTYDFRTSLTMHIKVFFQIEYCFLKRICKKLFYFISKNDCQKFIYNWF